MSINNLFKMLVPPDAEMELAAVWLNRAVTLGDGRRTPRITGGDLIEISNGTIVDCKKATHQVVGCYGTIYSSPLSIVALNLQTNEPLNLQL